MVGGFVVLVILAAIIAAQITIPYYVITPGDASPVGQYIEVPPADNHPISGKILLTDVFVSQLNALGYLQYRFLDSNNEIYSSQDLLGPSTSSRRVRRPGLPGDGTGPVVRARRPRSRTSATR